MTYRLQYSDYPGTAEGPPDPERWVGPPGPTGPMGPMGPQGPQGIAGNPFPEAPNDGAIYGRGGSTVAWVPTLPLTGGAVSGVTTFGGPLNYTATGSTVARAAQDRAAEVINVKDYGAMGNQTHDDTAAINAAIAVAATQLSASYWNPQLTGVVYFPPGLYGTNGIDLPCGVSLIGAGQLQTTIFIRANANRSVIRVLEDPASNPSPWMNRNHGKISGITVDGNSGAQTGTSHGIEVVASSYPLSTRYGSSVDIHDINIISTLNCCLYVGTNRNYGMITNLRTAYAGTWGIEFFACYDWYCQNIAIGNAHNDGMNIYQCAGLSFDDLVIWMSGGAGVVVNQCGGYMFFSNMQIDSNGTYGVWFSPGTGAFSVNSHLSISNAQFRDCSLTTDNAYPAIYTRNLGGAGTAVLLSNIWFNWSAATPNRPNYLIQTDASGFVQASNLGYSTLAGTTAGSAPYKTAAFNQPAQIVGAGATMIWTATGGTTPRSAQDRSADVVSAMDYGVVADGVTDNTVALQAAINAAQLQAGAGMIKRLQLPSGRIITQPLTIAGQIEIWGHHSNSTALVAKAGTSAPLLTIQTAGSATSPGAPVDYVGLQNLMLTAADGKNGNAAMDGIQLATGVRSIRVILRNVTIYLMSGNGIDASATFIGSLDAYDSYIFNNALIGVTCNSCNDWHFYGGSIAVNGQHGVLLSGCSQFCFTGINIYSNGINNVTLYSGSGVGSGSHQFIGVMFDRSAQVGLWYDMRGLSGATFIGCTFGGCSWPSPGTYSAAVITSTANNFATFVACNWPETFANNSALTDKWALEFQATTNQVVVDGTNHYASGPNVLRTNQPAQVFMAAPANAKVSTIAGYSLLFSQQYGGFSVLNTPTNSIFSVKGFTPTADNGVLNLYNGGVVGVQFSAANAWAPNYINNPLYLGNGGSNATPVGQSLRATDGSGANIAGASLAIAAGRGTGSGAGGALNFYTSPAGAAGSTLNSDMLRLTIDQNGNATYYNGLGVRTGQQYTGISLSNGTNTTAVLQGFTATNDAGSMMLLNGGSGVINFSAAFGNPSYINLPLYMGNGSTNAAPAGQSISATGGAGTDIAGGILYLQGGASTGAGAGGAIQLRTTPAGTTGTTANGQVARLIVDGPGNVVAGSGALATTATAGFFYIASGAGAPTGVPAGSYAGRVPMYYDSTTHKLWLYDAGWKGVVVS